MDNEDRINLDAEEGKENLRRTGRGLAQGIIGGLFIMATGGVAAPFLAGGYAVKTLIETKSDLDRYERERSGDE